MKFVVHLRTSRNRRNGRCVRCFHVRVNVRVRRVRHTYTSVVGVGEMDCHTAGMICRWSVSEQRMLPGHVRRQETNNCATLLHSDRNAHSYPAAHTARSQIHIPHRADIAARRCVLRPHQPGDIVSTAGYTTPRARYSLCAVVIWLHYCVLHVDGKSGKMLLLQEAPLMQTKVTPDHRLPNGER